MYWELDSTNYDLGNFNPNSRTLTFAENSGTLQITCFGLGSIRVSNPELAPTG